MEYIIFAIAMAGLVFMFILKEAFGYKKSEKNFIEKLPRCLQDSISKPFRSF